MAVMHKTKASVYVKAPRNQTTTMYLAMMLDVGAEHSEIHAEQQPTHIVVIGGK